MNECLSKGNSVATANGVCATTCCRTYKWLESSEMPGEGSTSKVIKPQPRIRVSYERQEVHGEVHIKITA